MRAGTVLEEEGIGRIEVLEVVPSAAEHRGAVLLEVTPTNLEPQAEEGSDE